MTPISIAILDDDSLFAEALALLLAQEPALNVLFYSCDSADLLLAFDNKGIPDVLLCDLKLQEENGLDLAGKLLTDHRDLRIIALSAYYKPVYMAAALRSGFSAFLPKNCTPEELVQAITAVRTAGIYYRPRDLALVQDFLKAPKDKAPGFGPTSGLSRREEEIVALICHQCTNAAIAEKLFISIRTVEGHRNRIIEKTGIKHTAGFVTFALVHGIVDLEELSLRENLRD